MWKILFCFLGFYVDEHQNEKTLYWCHLRKQYENSHIVSWTGKFYHFKHEWFKGR